jgi:peptidyl-prolyl cis-trans isomerase B (cyclophilin B)
MSLRVNPLCALMGAALVGLTTAAAAQTGQPAKTPAASPAQTSPGAGPIVVMETERGTFEFETYPNDAPKTVAHILALVKKGFYNGQRVHRVVPNFVIQLGDPASRDMTKKAQWGTGGSGSPIGVAELSKRLKHAPGIVSMAHAGDPAKADSQFFVCLGTPSHLDGKHQIFGKVISGMDVVRKIQVEDRIVRATVKEAS